MIQRIFTDLDGTLLTDNGVVAESNRQLIHHAGIPVTLVSARAPREMIATIRNLQLTGPQIAFNGGAVFTLNEDTINVLTAQPLMAEVLEQLATNIVPRFGHVGVNLFSSEQWYTVPGADGWRSLVSMTGDARVIDGHTNWRAWSDPVYKVTLLTSGKIETTELLDWLQQLQLPNVNIERSSEQIIDVTSQTASKAWGVNYIRQREKFEIQQTAAFGNGWNDISMFNAVGTSIAMANSPEQVRQAAQYVTLSNQEDGVGRGIQQYLLR